MAIIDSICSCLIVLQVSFDSIFSSLTNFMVHCHNDPTQRRLQSDTIVSYSFNDDRYAIRPDPVESAPVRGQFIAH